jgi:hypothetical protein
VIYVKGRINQLLDKTQTRMFVNNLGNPGIKYMMELECD